MPVGNLFRIVKMAAAVVAVVVAVMVGATLPAAVSAGAETYGPVAQASPSGQPRGNAAPTQAAPGNQQIDGQIADLRRRLTITPAQQAPFDALAQVMRQNAQEMSKLAAQQPQGKPNAVEALRAGQQFAQAEAEALGRMLPPLQALYGTLSDQQKRAADQVFASGPEQQERPAPTRR